MCRIAFAIQPNNVNDAQLQLLVQPRNLLVHTQNILHRLRHRTVRQEHECVPLARRVRLCGEESLDEFGRIGDEVLELTVDGVNGKDGVLSHVRVTVLETGAAGWDERLEKFGVLGDFLEESKGCTANVFVWVLLYEC